MYWSYIDIFILFEPLKTITMMKIFLVIIGLLGCAGSSLLHGARVPLKSDEENKEVKWPSDVALDQHEARQRKDQDKPVKKQKIMFPAAWTCENEIIEDIRVVIKDGVIKRVVRDEVPSILFTLNEDDETGTLGIRDHLQNPTTL